MQMPINTQHKLRRTIEVKSTHTDAIHAEVVGYCHLLDDRDMRWPIN